MELDAVVEKKKKKKKKSILFSNTMTMEQTEDFFLSVFILRISCHTL